MVYSEYILKSDSQRETMERKRPANSEEDNHEWAPALEYTVAAMNPEQAKNTRGCRKCVFFPMIAMGGLAANRAHRLPEKQQLETLVRCAEIRLVVCCSPDSGNLETAPTTKTTTFNTR